MRFRGFAWLGVSAAAVAVLAQDTPTSGARSGSVIASLTLFAGTRDGLWRSGTWGTSWDRVQAGPSGVSLEALAPVTAVSAVGPEVWAAGEGGLYVSNDFGSDWSALSQSGGIGSLLLSRWPTLDPTVFVGTRKGLLRSRDGGRTFAPTALADVTVSRMVWPGPALLVACDKGLYLSADEGERFERLETGLPDGATVDVVASTFFSMDPVLYAAPASGGVFRSADGGRSWRAAGLDGENVRDLVWLGPFLFAAGERGFFRMQGFGQPWERLSASPGVPRRLLFPQDPHVGLEAFLATDRGLFRTLDGGENWQLGGFEGREVLEVATFPPFDTKGSARR